MGTSLKVLIVEDSEADALLLMRALRKGGYDPSHERVETRPAMLDALQNQVWDIIVSDFSLPLFSGLAALELYKKLDLDIPFLVVSGNIGEDTAVATMKAGAHDYIMKNNLARLVVAVERELREAEIRRIKKQGEMFLLLQRDLGMTLSATADLKTALSLILDTAMRVSDMDSGTIYLLDSATRNWGMAQYQGLSDDFVNFSKTIGPNSPITRLFDTTTATYTNKQSLTKPQEVLTAQAIEKEGLHAIAFLPVLHQERAIANLVLASHQKEEFPRVPRSFLESLAVQIGTVVVRLKAEEELAQERNLLRILIDNIPDSIYIKNTESHFVLGNIAAAQLAGQNDPPDLVGRSDYDFFPPEFASKFFTDEQQIIQNGQSLINIEERTMDQNGKPSIFLTSKIPIKNQKTNKVDLLVGISRNITDRIHAQEKIQRQLAQLAALRHIDKAIASHGDLGPTLEIVLTEAINLLKVDAASVLRLNSNTGNLEFAAAMGNFRADRIRHVHLSPGDSFAWRSINENRMIVVTEIPDTYDAKHLGVMLSEEEFSIYIGVPLVVKGVTQGVLEIFNRQPIQLDTEWTDVVQTLAGQAAVALDNLILLKNLQEKNLEMSLAYDATIEGWARALEMRDMETEGHSQRVTDSALVLALSMGMRGDALVHLRRGALLHDIGKMSIPDSILLKPGPLTPAEWEVMREHPAIAYNLLLPIPFLHPALNIPYCHHEHWDGKGYPRGLKGEEIPLEARIFAIIDVWDAVTSVRPYRPQKWTTQEALDYLKSKSGTQFDPPVVEAFLRQIGN